MASERRVGRRRRRRRRGEEREEREEKGGKGRKSGEKRECVSMIFSTDRTAFPRNFDLFSRFSLENRPLGEQSGKSNRGGVFGRVGSCHSRFVLKHDVAIASEVSVSSKNSLAITDFLVKNTELVKHCENPLSGTPQSMPPFAR